MAPPVEYTFCGYWWSMAKKTPALLFYSWRAVVTIPSCILFFVALFNRQIAEHLFETWKGISPWWSFVVMGILLLWGLMQGIYERHRDLYAAYEAAEEKAEKAGVANTGASEYYIIGKDGSRLSNSGADTLGLFVKREDREEGEGKEKRLIPNYVLRFKKSPSRIEVTTQEGAVPKVKQVDANIFEVQFNSAGGGWFGSPIVECNFKIQVYQN